MTNPFTDMETLEQYQKRIAGIVATADFKKGDSFTVFDEQGKSETYTVWKRKGDNLVCRHYTADPDSFGEIFTDEHMTTAELQSKLKRFYLDEKRRELFFAVQTVQNRTYTGTYTFDGSIKPPKPEEEMTKPEMLEYLSRKMTCDPKTARISAAQKKINQGMVELFFKNQYDSLFQGLIRLAKILWEYSGSTNPLTLDEHASLSSITDATTISRLKEMLRTQMSTLGKKHRSDMASANTFMEAQPGEIVEIPEAIHDDMHKTTKDNPAYLEALLALSLLVEVYERENMEMTEPQREMFRKLPMQ